LKELEGKTALVTGASRGIGAATAIALARAGVARIVMHYGNYREGAEQTLALVEGAGAQADLIAGDLSTPAGIHAFVADLKKAAPEVDILINNAGSLVARAKLDDLSEELFDQIMNLNVKSVYFIAQALAPAMIRKGSGVIVNLSSIAARTGGGPGATIYSAAKAAVSAITKGLAKELAPKGIRVNAVSPGTVDNHFHEVFSTKQMLENMKASAPAGTLGTNEEVADTIVFLCSEPSRYIHGQTIEINGGMYMI
jgi:NAD(P)-dependent dehydrogenase (short-subunit alcohol dehydrogenase family)